LQTIKTRALLRILFKKYLQVTGWKPVNTIPPQLKKFVLAVGPHTSSWDIFMGFAFRSVLKMDHIKFIAKEELFRPPFGFLFRKLGGVPVDRFNNNNFVNQVVNMFNTNESFAIALSPEGTRKKVDRLRTGFYHIAKRANVPIVLLALDFEHKEFRFATPFYTSQNEAEDFKKIILFFKGIQGKNPALGLGHLQGN
jgi:1-acyl-sn-glycerol-3-phosphate acyltransferase